MEVQRNNSLRSGSSAASPTPPTPPTQWEVAMKAHNTLGGILQNELESAAPSLVEAVERIQSFNHGLIKLMEASSENALVGSNVPNVLEKRIESLTKDLKRYTSNIQTGIVHFVSYPANHFIQRGSNSTRGRGVVTGQLH